MTIDNENPYLLLTPGPLSTTPTVRAVMLRDWCTWDDDYNHGIVQVIRSKLVELAAEEAKGLGELTSVLMQGSGTFVVESVIGSALPPDGKLLILANGAYGRRIAKIAERLRIPMLVHDSGELKSPDPEELRKTLAEDPVVTHVAFVHGETTTGMLNPLETLVGTVKEAGLTVIVDAMSTFGGVPIDVGGLGIDFLISSANKCLQGVPGFGFVVARRPALEACEGLARSLSLDLFDQWKTMEEGGGKWRFTSPTHTVRAFAQALVELEEEGGIPARNERYLANQTRLVTGMESLGFPCLLPRALQSPIITAFRYPHEGFDFFKFYGLLKKAGFVIYPGKVTSVDTFRIGTIGDVHPEDIDRLLQAVEKSRYWLD